MPPFTTANARWTAVSTRDASASGAFVYCVTSTRIYCRPTCPARLARRANVVFHETAAEAEAAGFRACMRCRPGERDEGSGDPQRLAVGKACGLIRDEVRAGGRRWGVKGLAKEVGLTDSHFCRVFKKVMGVTVGDYRARVSGEEMSQCSWPVSSETPVEVPVAVAPSEFRYPDDGLHTSSFDSEELARDWDDFSGGCAMAGSTAMFPGFDGTDLMGFELSPEMMSDISTPAMTDDGLHFLNFDEKESSLEPYG